MADEIFRLSTSTWLSFSTELYEEAINNNQEILAKQVRAHGTAGADA